MDIGKWLEQLGLGKYTQVCLDNAIDTELLPDLEREDLKDLGLPVGDIRRLLRAIEEFAQTPSEPTSSDSRETELADFTPVASGEAERRQLTVMFADLVGSTELSQRLDPEELREINRAYQDTAKAAIEASGGFVARYMGDGVLAYFGYPEAHEDDAERSIRSSLDLIEAARDIEAPVTLSIRIGVATGPVVVGDIIGEGVSQESAVVGETPNLAARLQGIASPNAVVISDQTRRLAAGAFIYTDLGEVSLKGFKGKVQVWAVRGKGRSESRFEALRGTNVSAFVGREPDLAVLLERWAQALEGEGQAVLVSGEAGIGKSRITEALREQLHAPESVWLRHQCTPHHTTSALYPFIAQLERAAGFEPSDTDIDKVEKLRATLSSTGAPIEEESLCLLGSLLSLSILAPLDLSPQERKTRTFEALARQLDSLAKVQPLVWVFEDAHWADPTSRELLGYMIDRLQDLPALAIVTARPEYSPEWTTLGHTRLLTLGRFSKSQARDLISDLSLGRMLPDVVLDEIVSKTDGVPLFVEELTKDVLESGLLIERSGRYELAGPFKPLALPSTLQDSFMARLDRLGNAKRVAQTAAAIGREFQRPLLERVIEEPAPLEPSLAQLIGAGLLFTRGVAPTERHVFKHALLQDAALDSMLRRTRQGVHRRIAEVIEDEFPLVRENEPEVVAHHYGEAGEAERAIGYWHKAGLRAAQRSAYVETVGHITNALRLLDTLAESSARDEQELSLQTMLGPAQMAVGGFASDAVETAYSRARELCELTGRNESLVQILYGLFRLNMLRAHYERAYALAKELLSEAERQGDRPSLITAHRTIGNSAIWLGHAQETCEHAALGFSLYDSESDRDLAMRYGDDPGVDCLLYAAYAHWWLGRMDESEASRAKALSMARELADPMTMGRALVMSCMLQFSARNHAAAYADAEEGLRLTAEHRTVVWKAGAEMVLGASLVLEGEQSAGTALHRRGFAAFNATGARLGLDMFLSYAADAHAQAGDPAIGLEILEEAMAVETRLPFWEAELHRIRGDLGVRSGGPMAEIQADYEKAIELSRTHGAKSLTLRAALSLANFWSLHKRQRDAVKRLRPACDAMDEGFGTPDVVAAQTLLAKLASL